MEIILMNTKGTDIMPLPYVNSEKVSFSSGVASQTFTTHDGKTLTLLGEEEPEKMKVSSFFPHKRYRWMSHLVFIAPLCIAFIKRHRTEPIIVTVVSEERCFSKAFFIDSFEYTRRRNKDIHYTLSMTEYIDK